MATSLQILCNKQNAPKVHETRRDQTKKADEISWYLFLLVRGWFIKYFECQVCRWQQNLGVKGTQWQMPDQNVQAEVEESWYRELSQICYSASACPYAYAYVGSFYVSVKLPTYPFPTPTFCFK